MSHSHTHTYTHTHIYIYIYTHSSIYTYLCIRMYPHENIHTQSSIYNLVHVGNAIIDFLYETTKNNNTFLRIHPGARVRRAYPWTATTYQLMAHLLPLEPISHGTPATTNNATPRAGSRCSSLDSGLWSSFSSTLT